MDSRELREKFVNFFKEKGHNVIPSASLIPENDPSVLFTTAGMHPLVPYLMGEPHPAGKHLVGIQKCIRTGDIDEVGDKVHHTFFEMLGNWSLGSYFKSEAIVWSYEFLTSKENLGLDPTRLAVSVFAGDEDAPFDQEAYDKWIELGLSGERIAKLPKKDNWWGPAGESGPCGPDTEIFYWTGKEKAPANFQVTHDNPSWVEIWNNVFMQYNKTKDGRFEPLKQKNVDTGMGMERTLAVMEGFDDNYKTELFWPIIKEIEEIAGKTYTAHESEFRIIADHLKAATFAINDGVVPSNKEAGYIVRRLIRRAIVKAHQLGIEHNFTTKIAKKIFDIYDGVYFNIANISVIPAKAGIQDSPHGSPGITPNHIADSEDDKRKMILAELEKEESKFRRTLIQGLAELYRLGGFNSSIGLSKTDHLLSVDELKSLRKRTPKFHEFDGSDLFNLFQSFGLPLEISLEESNRLGISINNKAIEQFNNLVIEHQEFSRTASAGMFKGGLADSGEETRKLHTAAHLLLAALRKVLGDGVFQKGSNITPERLRFDFSYAEKMTREQIRQVEDLVNEQIKKDLPVKMEEMNLDEAKKQGAMGVFDSKYGEKVKVYTIGPSTSSGSPFSREICGGPHAGHTGELGHFKIAKEESSSAGVRRIKAILE